MNTHACTSLNAQVLPQPSKRNVTIGVLYAVYLLQEVYRDNKRRAERAAKERIELLGLFILQLPTPLPGFLPIEWAWFLIRGKLWCMMGLTHSMCVAFGLGLCAL